MSRALSKSVTAISHSMALPNLISSHVDCIRIGGATAQSEARAYLSYPYSERWFRKSTCRADEDYSDTPQRTMLPVFDDSLLNSLLP